MDYRLFRSLLLCPLSVERYYFPWFVDSTQALWASFCVRWQQFILRSTCKCVCVCVCVYVCVHMLNQFRDLTTMSCLEWKLVLSYACKHLCRRMCLKWRVYMPLGASFFEDVPLVEFTYLVFTRTPGGVTVGDSSVCCRVPLRHYSTQMHYLCALVCRS